MKHHTIFTDDNFVVEVPDEPTPARGWTLLHIAVAVLALLGAVAVVWMWL